MFLSLTKIREDAMKIIKENNITCPAEVYFAVINATNGDVIQKRVNKVVDSICRELNIPQEW